MSSAISAIASPFTSQVDMFSDALFGSAPSTQTISAEDKIMPADATENDLYSQLSGLNTDTLDYASYLGDQRTGLFDTTMANLYNYANDLNGMSYDGQLNPQMASQLQDMLQNQLSSIDNYAESGVGSIMNNYANRGVLNSSATGGAMGDLGTNVQNLQNDAMNNYMNTYMQSYGDQYNADLQRLLAGQSMAMQPYSFLDSAYNNAYSDPFNMWSKIRSDRYGLQNDYIQTPATEGIAGDLLGFGGMLAMSDKRLKENIVKVREADGSDCKIDGHQIYTWDWNEKAIELLGTDEYPNSIGVLAQEVMETRPDVVITDQDDGYMRVDYGKLFGEA